MKGMEGGEVKLTPHPGKTILKKRIVQRLLLFFLIFSGFLFPFGYYKTILSMSAVTETSSYFL